MKTTINSILVTSLCATAAAQGVQSEEQRELPNIIFFMTEDLSPHFLALFNDGKGCLTPNVERLAKEGITYTNAYSSAAVSSAARTTLITGCYAPRFAGSLHRHIEPSPLPIGLKTIPSCLRDGGYLTINAKKTDYNIIPEEDMWDQTANTIDTWRTRSDKSQPFFLQRSNLLTHEYNAHFSEETYQNKKTHNDPNDVVLMPWSQDTPLMRYTYATLYDRIQSVDQELGELIDMLEEDGELDNTFIFFMGDNGGVMPGTKGYSNNVGFHVPLVVYIPEKWRDSIGQEIGSEQDGLVSFIDLGPTALNLANVEIPEQMDGEAILGEGSITSHESVICYADRFDELYSLNRTIRDDQYRYARNYQPYQTQSLYNNYRYKMLAFVEWKDLYFDGKLNSAQSDFFETMGPDELYDLVRDPMELNNLCQDPNYSDVVESLRDEMNTYMLDKCDLGFFPEAVIHEEGMDNPDEWGDRSQERIARLMKVADLQLLPFAKAKKSLKQALHSVDPVEQWWALTTCTWFGGQAASLKAEAQKLLLHERSYVRVRAMLFLATLGEDFSGDDLKVELDRCVVGAESLLILNDFTHLLEQGYIAPFTITEEDVKLPTTDTSIDRVNYFNTLCEQQ